jgi:hypothetical protein
MMFSKKSIFFVAFCLVAGGFYYLKTIDFNESSEETSKVTQKVDDHDSHQNHDHKDGGSKSGKSTDSKNPKVKLDPKLSAHDAHHSDPHKMGKTVKLPPINEREAFKPINERERSLETMTNEVLNLVQEGRSHGEFIEFLKKNELAPRVADSENEDTGGMIMIRSDESLPGTRYYHAQFFKGE